MLPDRRSVRVNVAVGEGQLSATSRGTLIDCTGGRSLLLDVTDGVPVIGIPLLSIVMDPVTAGGLLAPLFIAMDLFALRYWKPSTWSKPDLALLVPGLVIGIAFGYLLFRVLDHRAVAIVMAVTTLVFVGLWFVGGSEATIRPRSSPKAVAAGLASGVTSVRRESPEPSEKTRPAGSIPAARSRSPKTAIPAASLDSAVAGPRARPTVRSSSSA